MAVRTALWQAVAFAWCVTLAQGLIAYKKDGSSETFHHLTAMFGPEAGTYNVNGTLFLLEGEDQKLCSPLEAGVLEGMVAVVIRGDCHFSDKAVNAQNAGALGVVVGDNMDEALVVMSPNKEAPPINIPSVFVTQATLNAIQILGEDITAAVLNEEGENEPQNNQVQYMLWILRSSCALVSVMIGMTLLCMSTRAFAWCRNRTNRHHRFDAAQRMPLLEYGNTENLVMNEACAICLEDFVATTKIRILPCHHGFHTECISSWFDYSELCPICKGSLFTETDDPLFAELHQRQRICCCGYCYCCGSNGSNCCTWRRQAPDSIIQRGQRGRGEEREEREISSPPHNVLAGAAQPTEEPGESPYVRVVA